MVAVLLMFSIDAPVNAGYFFAETIKVSAFNFFEVEPATNFLFYLDPTGALTEKLEQLGIESKYLLNNMGSLTLVFVAYPIMMLILPKLKQCCGQSTVANESSKLHRLLVWDYLITALKSNAAIISVYLCINFKALDLTYYGAFVHSLVAIGFFLLLTIFPAYSIWWLHRNFETLSDGSDSSRIKKRFGAWLAGLEISQGKRVLVWPAFFVLRRLLMAHAVIYSDKFIYQAFMLMTQVLFAIIYFANARPWEDRSQWKKQLAREVLLLVAYYHLVCFTPFFEDPSKQYIVGYSLIVIVGSHFAFGLAQIVYADIKAALWQFQLWKIKMQMREQTQAMKCRIITRKSKALANQKADLDGPQKPPN